MHNKINYFFIKTLPHTILTISSRYVTFKVNKNAQNDKKDKLYDYFYCLYLFYLISFIFRTGVAALVIHRIITTFSISPEHYFATVDLLIGHMLKIGLLNRHMGLPCVPFILLALFDHWFYFGGSSSGGGGGGDLRHAGDEHRPPDEASL